MWAAAMRSSICWKSESERPKADFFQPLLLAVLVELFSKLQAFGVHEQTD